MPKPFGITINEDVVFKVSLALLSLLALLWIFIMVVILWLRKIQRRVDKATTALTSISINSWSPTNTLNAFAYSAEHINEDEKDLGQTSFECVEAKRENDEVFNVSIAETPFSSSEHSEIANGDQSKHYTSLKDHRSIKYEKLRDSEKTSQNLTNTEDFVYSKYEAVTPPHNPSNQTHVLTGDDKAQSTEHHRVKPQHSGETSTIVANNTVEGYIEAEADASQCDYENEYLAIIHTEGMSPEDPKDTIENVLCQENEYLMPIETAETETRQGKYNKIHSEGNKTKVSQPADSSTGMANHGYLATKETEKSAKNDRESGLGSQDTEHALKGSKENDDGYINIDRSSKDSRNRSSACSAGGKGDQLKRNDSVDEYSQYDYITVRQRKDQPVSSGKGSKPQERNLSPGNATNPQKHNPTRCQEAHYINKDTAAVHARNENAEPSSEYSNEYLAVIHDEDFKTRKESPGREAHLTTQATSQDTGIGCSGDAPIYENPDFGNASDFPIYANEKTSKK